MTRAGDMAALIMAGGRGTRMAARHPDVPKPLVRVGGLALLEINLRQLARLGVRDVWVAVHHQAAQIAEWLREHAPAPGVNVAFLVEARPRGTIGSLSELRHLQRPILVTNGDLLSGIDLEELLAFHTERRADLTIATHTEQHRLRLGEVVVGDGGRVVRYREKPLKEYSISSGVYVWSVRALSAVDTDDWQSLPDLVNRVVDGGLEVVAYHHEEPWLDVNDEDDRARAEAMLRDDPVAFGIDPELLQR